MRPAIFVRRRLQHEHLITATTAKRALPGGTLVYNPRLATGGRLHDPTANPTDQMIYYYSEGMAAPMGDFQNYRRVPRAVMVVDRSLREEALGVYSTTARLPKAGVYNVSMLLDSPRVVHCLKQWPHRIRR